MLILFNVDKEGRKAMVKAIEEELGVKAAYLGMPTCAYQIGEFRVGKLGELEYPDEETEQEAHRIIDACLLATGVRPEGLPEKEVANEPTALIISVPLDKVNVPNLKALIDAKGNLIRKAFCLEDLGIVVGEEKVSFPWFESDLDSDSVHAYTQFIEALCKMSVSQKRVQAKEKDVENEKYAFRCFLLRLGFIGDEFKKTRKILLKNLEGSSAFKVKKGDMGDAAVTK